MGLIRLVYEVMSSLALASMQKKETSGCQLLMTVVYHSKSKKVPLMIKSIDGETQSTVEAWTLQEMCQGLTIPDWNKHKVEWDHLKNIAFPKAPGRKTIDLLIG